MNECKIAERLSELRVAKGLTQKEVAASFAISDKTLSKWENGTSEPDLAMLIRLAEFYKVSTDSLLGISSGESHETLNPLKAEFQNLDRKESILKAFDLARSVIPMTFNKFAQSSDDVNDGVEVFPQDISHYSRSQISAHDFFEFVASSEDVNVAVMLLRNKSDFGWMKDPKKQKKIIRFFKFLSDEDALSVLYFIHSTACSESFTADYVSNNTAVPEEKVSAILDEFCAVGCCMRVKAHLEEGTTTIYESFGDGMMLSVITLAYEQTCGRNAYSYNFNGRCKMIGGKI